MGKKNKRGLSAVVATLLIILLVLVATAVIWVVIRNVISENSKSITLSSFTINLEIVKVSPSNGTTNTCIEVRRNKGEGNLIGIIFSIRDELMKTHIYREEDVNLEELDTKEFCLNYTGNISSVSIYPLILTDSSKKIIGEVESTYIVQGASGDGGESQCTPSCDGRQCGNNGCGGVCGVCESGDYCDKGVCCPIGYSADPNGMCTKQCSHEENCIGKQCGSDGCGGTCTLPGKTGNCKTDFGENFFCNSNQICEECIPNCAGKQCGSDGCGGTCGDCKKNFGSEYNCNALTFECEKCTPNCDGGKRNCGVSLNDCGYCGNDPEGKCENPEDKCINGICTPPETTMNIGVITSVWPEPVGRNFITGSELPGYDESGDAYNLTKAKYIKIIKSYSTCYQIIKLEYPVNEGQNTVIQVSTAATNIEKGDVYELWETHDGCKG